MRSTDLTLRKDLDRPIDWDEMDTNLENLDSDSPWLVHNGHISYSGKVSINGVDAEYDLDFMNGVNVGGNNIATLGTQDAELQVHIDGANSFKVFTNIQERVTLTTDGLTGIGVTEPEYPLDVDGVIQTTTTFLGNQAYCNSFYDGTLTISGGSITNSQTIVNLGVIQWTSLYDRSTGITVREWEQDEISGAFDKVPLSYAVKNHVDSEHAWNMDEHDLLEAFAVFNVDRIDSALDSMNGKLRITGLHEVTDIGNSTTNDIKVLNITTTGFTDSGAATSLVLRPDGDLFGTVTGGWKVPVGTTGQRPSDTTGYMRFNTSNSAFEGYNGSAWASLGGVMDVDQDTYILPELSPTSDEDTLFFYTAGTEKMRIDPTGIVQVGTETAIGGTAKLQVDGDGYFNGNLFANGVARPGSAGVFFTVDASIPTLVPVDGTMSATDGVLNLGQSGYGIRTSRFKDGYFTGTLSAASANLTTSITAPFFIGQLTGTLTTPRNINGTAFDGGSNITTVQWGTPRNMTIGDTTKSVNGSTNYAWTKAEIGLTKANLDALALSVNNADKLTTPRNINGTAFDGTANITTAQWGTARNISIGGTSKSLNGSTNYTWSAAEITAGQLSNSFTVQGTAFNGSAAKSVTFTGGDGITVTGTVISNDHKVLSSGGNGINLSYPAPGLVVAAMSGSYTGTFTATGDVVAYSDIALKEDINPITAALDKVSQLTGYTFRRKGEEKVSTGVMAQEVQAVLPEAVHDNEGTLGVAYGNMVGLLIEAVKELSGKVESLETELNKTK